MRSTAAKRKSRKKERLDGKDGRGSSKHDRSDAAQISPYRNRKTLDTKLVKSVTPAMLALLEKHPEHKQIYFDSVMKYNNDPQFRGTMEEVQHLAMLDLILHLHVRYMLDNESVKQVEEQKENNKMVREVTEAKRRMMKEIYSRTERAADRARLASVFDAMDAEDGEYREVKEDADEKD